jgi:hypothetical protein
MAIMGWSSAAMAARYQHVLDSILKGVAGQVGGLLWDAPESDPAAADDDDGEGTVGVLAPACYSQLRPKLRPARQRASPSDGLALTF